MVDYLLIALFIFLSAFFSGSETGFYSLNHIRLRFRLEHGWPGAAALRRLSARPQDTISTVLIGNNITHYVTTVLCTQKLVELGLGYRADLYSSLIVPPLLLVFAEIVPKTVFRRRADALMYRAAWVLHLCRLLFFPVLILLRGILEALLRLTGRGARGGRGMVTRERFQFFLSEGAAVGVLSPYQHAMADNILRVRSLKLRSPMVPIQQVAMASEETPVGELRHMFRAHRFSRFPVFRGTRDNIVGTVNVVDVLSAGPGVQRVSELIRAVLFLGADLPVAEALYSLQRAHQQMAVVTDDDGQPVGMVTVKDLVEEIVGELRAW